MERQKVEAWTTDDSVRILQHGNTAYGVKSWSTLRGLLTQEYSITDVKEDGSRGLED